MALQRKKIAMREKFGFEKKLHASIFVRLSLSLSLALTHTISLSHTNLHTLSL